MTIAEEVIKKIDGKWFLFTKDGSRKLGGPYNSRKEALDREKQVQYFKHIKGGETMPSIYETRKMIVEKVPEGLTPRKPKDSEALAMLKSLGIEVEEAGPGNYQRLVDTFGDWAGGSFEKCVEILSTKKDITDPEKVCARMKDDYIGNTSWRGKGKHITTPESAEVAGGVAEDEIAMKSSEPSDYVPWGVTSFAELYQVQAAQTTALTIKATASQFARMVSNVFDNAQIEDKVSALVALSYELGEIMPELTKNMQDQMSLSQEAATIKSRVKSAINALDALLEDKSIPKTIVSQVKGLRETFRRTWKDLGDEADIEKASDRGRSSESIKVAESYGGEVTMVSEAKGEADPLTMQVKLIRPGWGNTKDNHYYTREMLATNAEKFKDAKMHESDHKANEKSNKTWVSTVNRIVGFTDDGAPIAEVLAHEPNFIQRVRNLEKAGKLNLLECSILAGAIADKATYEQGGRKGKLIKEITDVESVDWVTRAGAGGHALSIAELAANPTEEVSMTEDKDKVVAPAVETPQVEKVAVTETVAPPAPPEKLTVEAVSVALEKTSLPKVAKDRLSAGSYPDTQALQTAIVSEVEYLKAVTGSGKPFGLGVSESVDTTHKMSKEEYDKAIDKVVFGEGGK